MAHSDDLFSLVHSLSKSEKRYFKMYASLQEGDKAYLGLFNLLESNDEGFQIKEKFETKFKNSSYDSSRKHLYKIIMRCLRNYETHKSIDQSLLSIISDVKILLNKGLFELAISEIERGKKMALKNEKFLLFLILARMELQYLTLTEFPDIDENGLIERQEKINSLLYDELFVNKYSSLCELLLHRYIHKGVIRSEAEQTKLNDLVLEEFQINANQRFHNFQTDKLHLHFQSTYFLITGDARQSLGEFYNLDALIQEHFIQWEEDPLYYVYLLHGILLNLRTLKEYDQIKSYIERLKKLQVNSSGIQKIIQHFVFQHETSLLIDQGRFNLGLENLNQFKKNVEVQMHVPFNVLASTRLTSAVVFFGTRDYKEALACANSVLELPEQHISKYTYVICRIIILIIHVELKNDDLLEYSIRSFERKLKLGKMLFSTEKITIDFLKKWIAASDPMRRQILSHFEQQLQAIHEDKYEQQVLRFFDLISWAQSHLNKKSFAEQVLCKQV